MAPFFIRILDARHKALNTDHRVPNVIKFPAQEAAEFCHFLTTLESNPFLGFAPWGKQMFGMIFIEDHSVTEITACYEE